jgi:hypothetical protein
MGFFDRFRKREKKDLTPSERQIVELLTAGDVPEFTRLRAQWSDPFGMWVERQPLSKDRYEIALIYDGNTEEEHWIGETLKFDIDDLVILDRRIGMPIPCVGHVHKGILSNIIWVAPQPVRWPTDLNVDDWFYVDANGALGKSRTRDWPARIAAAHEPPRIDSDIDAVIPTDYREYIGRRGRSLEIEDVTLLRLPDLYFLDHPSISGRFLVFGSLSDASVMAFDVPEHAREPDGVYFVSVDDAVPERIADSFTEWLKAPAAWLDDRHD